MAPNDDTTSDVTATTADTAQRLAELRDRAGTDPAGAANEAWELVKSLRDSDLKDYDRAASDLEAMFRASSPPASLEGQTEGLLVMTTTLPILDRTVTAVTDLWMPWEGKRFGSAGTGSNRISSRASMPLRLLWPLYNMTQTDDGKLAFDFKTHVEASRDKDGQDQEVLVIDYKSIETNPRLLIRSVRDELVELVPGVYLGKILFRVKGKYLKIGFFALHKTD
ncbi:hypothetical protein IEU95_09455 [Hoyosella rhizosphaerae]|uniref:Uncharacterized protein n=1 Tax=Hoyosella rhizosphaerae TaxID=1755582 RepID=A0A916U0C1_9ACTN|nr:hypothetical protein [Hoyosella rhizosphaerae]MBN4927057.1 hypothetical protein [Hoyosella rhizosphaerae]GGC54373.1 hypothetical protein GCM10011410_03430 [Hoyosella rhizosphaerae]